MAKKAVKKAGPVVLYAQTEDHYDDVRILTAAPKSTQCPQGHECDYCALDQRGEVLCWDAAELLGLKPNKKYKLTIQVEEIK